ncbi:MAG TPA: hypothetical protein VF945_13955 [Polyangia bacterium]
MGAPRSRTLGQLWPELSLVTLGIALRVAMNVSYDVRWSYDFDDHWAYIEHLAHQWSWMPLAESRAAYHPPLYHALAALAVRAGAGVQAIGWISIGSGCARLMLIFWGLERWLDESRAARLAALALAAVLPASVHVDGMLTNEALNGLLGTAATLLAARYFVVDGAARWRRGLELGAVVGLALLVKVSALVILGAVALVGIVEAVRAHDAARARPLAAVVVAAALVSGAWFAHCRAAHGKWILSGFDGADAPRAVGHLDQPYWRRRPLGFYVGFAPHIFAAPYAPTGLAPRADFATPLFASAFVDYYNYGYAPYPAELDSALRGNYRPLRRDVLALSRVSIAGGALVAVATLAGFVGCVVVCWRRRDWPRLAMLAVPALAVAGQLHFAVKFPIDSEGMVKAVYLQFAAAPLCATFGVAVAWLWQRRRTRALAVAELAAVAAVAVYAIACRFI